MSWLARSLANSLRIDDDNENDVVLTAETLNHGNESAIDDGGEEEEEGWEDQTRGVKEDLSEFKLVLTRQLWEVASFLAPPPPPTDQPSPSDRDRSSHPSDRLDPPPEMAWQEEEEFEEESFVGVTEEVMAFARNIAMHPETWLDFPLDEEDDLDDFDLSDAQREHVMVIERLAPRLKALRIELCPCHMSEGYFWKVYFVLLHSRLNKQDAETLSTPLVMSARAKWMQELQSHTTSESELFGSGTSCLQDGSDRSHEDHIPVSPSMEYYEDIPLGTFPSQPTMFSVSTIAYESEKHPIEGSSELLQFIDKSIIEEKPAVKFQDTNFTVGPSYNILAKNHARNHNNKDDEDDDWPEEDFEYNEYSGTSNHVVNEEEISFSDLEDDDFQAPKALKATSEECKEPVRDR